MPDIKCQRLKKKSSKYLKGTVKIKEFILFLFLIFWEGKTKKNNSKSYFPLGTDCCLLQAISKPPLRPNLCVGSRKSILEIVDYYCGCPPQSALILTLIVGFEMACSVILGPVNIQITSEVWYFLKITPSSPTVDRRLMY